MILQKNYEPIFKKLRKRFDANVKLVEVPPGPPVLSTIVAEIYGPDYNEQIKIANQVKRNCCKQRVILLMLTEWLKQIKQNIIL